MRAIRTKLKEIPIMKKSSILLIFKDIENLAFRGGKEVLMQHCFLVSPFCRRRRGCSNSLVPLPRKSVVLICDDFVEETDEFVKAQWQLDAV